MINSPLSYRSLFMLPTGQSYPPASVGELPSYEYQVSSETITENVSSHLEAHPEIPGVILISDGKVHSMIPRSKLFERLGHRYGVELFLRKPIANLQESLETAPCIVSSNMRITEAISNALCRKTESIYEPLVVEYDNGSFQLLDIHTLIMAQSLVMENMNNIISSMNRIEQSIKADIPLDTSLEMIIDAIKRTIPYHNAAILIKPSHWAKISSNNELLYHLSESLSSHPLIKSIFETKQHTFIENTKRVPSWAGMEVLGKANTWMGLPIASARNFDGILSLSRATDTPFNKNEIDMAKTFSEFMCIAINRTTEHYDDDQFTNMIKRKFIY